MKCLICNESSEKSLCDACSNTKRCADCNKDWTDFYSYKNGKMYKICKECFNEKVRCEFCNKELNKSYLRSHIKKQHIQHNNQQHYNQQHYNQQQYNQYIEKHHYNQQQNNDGASEDASENNSGASENIRSLIVGPSFCGKTHL